jgi:hypothetical protein
LFFCVSTIVKSFVAIDVFYKSCAETDSSMVHYATIIEPFGVLPIEPLSFDAKQFTNNYTKNVLESKTNDPFLLLEEYFFAAIVE